jgi:hypothetical protein
MFVVDAKATPMAIVGEYDQATVRGNGCGGVEIAKSMYLNSGGSPVNVSGTDPKHPALYGFDLDVVPSTPGDLDAMGVRLMRGRLFSAEDAGSELRSPSSARPPAGEHTPGSSL